MNTPIISIPAWSYPWIRGTFTCFCSLMLLAACSKPVPELPPSKKYGAPNDGAFATRTVFYPARQKTQLHTGVYDAKSQRTYVVYPAGKKDGLSACSPYIIYYDHKEGFWSIPVEITASPVKPDAHNYPQLLIDSKGHLHVLQAFHGNHDILHAVSKHPEDITSWKVSYIKETKGATYGAAYKAKDGTFYFLSRIREKATPSHENYEPEYYLKSTDDGKTWQKQRLIDPRPHADGWGTIYTKGILYSKEPEGLHITFGVHQKHNIYLQKHYYIFFKFSDGQVYNAKGEALGSDVDRKEYEASCLLFAHTHRQDFYNVRVALAQTPDKQPVILYNRKADRDGKTSQGTPIKEGEQRLIKASWDGQKWLHQDLGYTSVYPFGAQAISKDKIRLFATKSRKTFNEYILEGDKLTQGKQLAKVQKEDHVLTHIMWLTHSAPSLSGMYYEAPRASWHKPPANGSLFGFALP